jgi:5-methylcytosine-specific restriction endonuclease McrA
MPTRLCAWPRCGNPATYRGYCPEHARTNNQATHRNRTVYNSAKWKHTRKLVLFEQPLCPCGDIATDVDHITAIEAGGNPWVRSNLQALCASCHGRKTRQEQATQCPDRPSRSS